MIIRAYLDCAIITGHTDVVHAVESEHNGKADSSVLYIPAVPLTERKYVCFLAV